MEIDASEIAADLELYVKPIPLPACTIPQGRDTFPLENVSGDDA